MKNQDILLKLAIIFIISFGSFCIGTYIGKAFNEPVPTAVNSLDPARDKMQEAALDCKNRNKILKDFSYDFKTGSYDYVCEESK